MKNLLIVLLIIIIAGLLVIQNDSVVESNMKYPELDALMIHSVFSKNFFFKQANKTYVKRTFAEISYYTPIINFSNNNFIPAVEKTCFLNSSPELVKQKNSDKKDKFYLPGT